MTLTCLFYVCSAEDALESSNLDIVQDAYDALYGAAQLLGEAIYQGAKSQTGDGDLGDLDDDELLEDFNFLSDHSYGNFFS